MLVFMMQVGFLLLETGLIQERHQAGVAVKSMMMLLASSTAYTLVGHRLVWGNSAYPLTTAEWQFFQTGFAAVAATILSGSMAGRTTLISNVIMAALVGGVFYPLHAGYVWGGGFLSHPPYRVHDFAGSGCVHLLGGLVALAGSIAAGPRSEKIDIRQGAPIHISPRSLPVAACGVLFLWIGWMGFNGGSIQSASQLNIVGRLLISTCLAATAGGFAVSLFASINRLIRREVFVYAPYATLSGIMAGMVANSAACDLIAASSLNRSLVVGSVAGVFAYVANWILQQFFRIDDPIEAVAVHAGGGFVGLIFAGIYQSPRNLTPQFVDIAVLVTITVVPSWIIFKIIDFLGHIDIEGRTPLRLKSSPDEEQLGLIFDDPATRVGPPPVHFHYLPSDVKAQIYDYLSLLTSVPGHIARRLYAKAEELIQRMKHVPPEGPTEADVLDLERMRDDLQWRIDSVPDVLTRLRSGIGERVQLDLLVKEIAAEYRERYPKVTVALDLSTSPIFVNGDAKLTGEAIKMVLSNSMISCMKRVDRKNIQHLPKEYSPNVLIKIDAHPPKADGHVFLDIEDNGFGIDRYTRDRLGQPLARSTEGRGLGLGLFFAAWITTQFGGQLECKAARDPMRGSTEKTVLRFQLVKSA